MQHGFHSDREHITNSWTFVTCLLYNSPWLSYSNLTGASSASQLQKWSTASVQGMRAQGVQMTKPWLSPPCPTASTGAAAGILVNRHFSLIRTNWENWWAQTFVQLAAQGRKIRWTLIIFLHVRQVKRRGAFNPMKRLIFEQLFSETW